MSYENILWRFSEWAQTDDNLRAAILIGSRARTDHPADEWSDMDIILLAEDPQRYWAESAWLDALGEVWLTFIEPTPDGRGFERRALFAGGMDVDFAPMPIAGFRHMLSGELPADLADIIRRGVRVLVDKDHLFSALPAVGEKPQPAAPQESEYLNVVHDFWYHAVWTAKHLRRGELWWAKGGCDGHLKHLLFRMITWHAQVKQGPAVDTWMRGRFLEEWADERAVRSLPEVFAHYDSEDIWRALLATQQLFRWLALETAQLNGFDYPGEGDAHAAELVQQLYDQR